MCLGIPVRLCALDEGHDGRAWAEVDGGQRLINTALLDGEPLATGDWVLVHAGLALAKLDEHEALATLEVLAQMAGAGGQALG